MKRKNYIYIKQIIRNIILIDVILKSIRQEKFFLRREARAAG